MSPPREIPPCPAGGEGVHAWMMAAAWTCRRAGMDAARAADEIAARITRRPNPPNEIGAAVAKVFDCQVIIGDRSRGWAPPQKFPDPDLEKIAGLPGGHVDLWEASPIRDADTIPTGEILGNLFPGNPLLCVGTARKFSTMPLSDFADRAATLPQIVPSPMLAKFGRTKTGRLSAHALEATGPRRFIVIEGDRTSPDQQAAVLLHLRARGAPLAVVCESGKKSLHGWFLCAGHTDAQLAAFFRYAVTLGADRALWTRSQFVRMPNAIRPETRRQQAVIFFDPSHL